MLDSRNIIKVCGMRDARNIKEVSQLPISLMGFIFWPKSSRNVEKHPGVDLPPTVRKVGVFVDETLPRIMARVGEFHLDYIQLHGSETADTLRQLRCALDAEGLTDVRLIKALSIREADDVKRWRLYADVADLLLFDTKCKCVGGSGEQFDWSVLEAYDGNLPFLLSGGIGPDDVGKVKAFHHPMCIGIDLNSRFELSPALKDAAKLSTFISKLNSLE